MFGANREQHSAEEGMWHYSLPVFFFFPFLFWRLYHLFSGLYSIPLPSSCLPKALHQYTDCLHSQFLHLICFCPFLKCQNIQLCMLQAHKLLWIISSISSLSTDKSEFLLLISLFHSVILIEIATIALSPRCFHLWCESVVSKFKPWNSVKQRTQQKEYAFI